jgi:hypothetical protein
MERRTGAAACGNGRATACRLLGLRWRLGDEWTAARARLGAARWFGGGNARGRRTAGGAARGETNGPRDRQGDAVTTRADSIPGAPRPRRRSDADRRKPSCGTPDAPGGVRAGKWWTRGRRGRPTLRRGEKHPPRPVPRPQTACGAAVSRRRLCSRRHRASPGQGPRPHRPPLSRPAGRLVTGIEAMAKAFHPGMKVRAKAKAAAIRVRGTRNSRSAGAGL